MISVVNMKKILFLSLILSITLSFSVTALVLSGGGARGFAHVGLLRVLQLYNIKPKIVIGTSAGALIGAFYACGYTPLEMMDVVKEFNKKKIMEEAFPNLPISVISWKPIEKFLYKYLGNKNIEDLKVKLAIVATNIKTGQIEIFTKGNLLKAVEASCSIPGFFPPVKIGDNYYVDGGVLLNEPTTIAHSFGADKVVLSVVSDQSLGIKKNTPYFERVFFDLLYNLRNSLSKDLNINDMSNMLDLTMKSVDFYNFSQFVYDRATKDVDLVLNPLNSIRGFSTVFDFKNAQKYYQFGMLNAIAHSDEIQKIFK